MTTRQILDQGGVLPFWGGFFSRAVYVITNSALPAERDLRSISLLLSHCRLYLTIHMAESYWLEEIFPRLFTIYIEGQKEELRSDLPVQYLNKGSHGQNLSWASGQAEFFAPFF